jgi:hypothetical protein
MRELGLEFFEILSELRGSFVELVELRVHHAPPL